MATEVTVGSTQLTVTGTQGNLNLKSGWFVNIDITEAQFLELSQAFVKEGEAAFPDVQLSVIQNGASNK